MNLRRVFLISKNFWPVSGQTELLAAAFAEQLAGQVDQVDVITWRMIRQWPDRFLCGRCNVIRLPQSHRTSWSPAALGYYGRNRWHRSLQRWIVGQGNEYDAGFVFEFESDGLAPSVIVGKTGIPIVSRVQQKLFRKPGRTSLRDLKSLKHQPVCFVTPEQNMLLDPLAADDGVLAGLRCVPDGLPSLEQRSVQPTQRPDVIQRQDKVRDCQQEARNVLRRVHPIFQLEEGALLLVCGAELTFESGVFSVVRAWRRIQATYPDARLWLIGTGRNAPELYQRICDLDMQHSVLLTGNFDDVTDLLTAADAYVIPGLERPGWYANTASQLGLTVIHHRDCADVQSTTGTVTFDDDHRPIDLVLGRWAASRQGLEDDSPDSDRLSGTPANPKEPAISNSDHGSLVSGPDIAQMVVEYVALAQQQRQAING